MDVSTFFLTLIAVLLSSKLVSELFIRIGISAVLGEVIAGIIIGPSVLGLVTPGGIFSVLSEIGILLLLFEVGLETDVGQLVKEGIRSTLVAVTGVLLPAMGSYWAARAWFGMDELSALFIGGITVATSIGITIRALRELGQLNTRMTRTVLGAAVLDDVIGVVVLAVLYDLVARGTVSVFGTLRILGFILLFLVLAPVAARLFVPLLEKLVSQARATGMVPAVVISMVLALAVAAHAAGAPYFLGSFAAGVSLTRKFSLSLGGPVGAIRPGFVEHIGKRMQPIIELFVPVFFVMVGVSIDLRAAGAGSGTLWGATVALTCIAVTTKMASGVWAAGGWREKLATGIAMVPRGEVGLIFAEAGKRSAVLDDRTYAMAVFVVSFSTLIGPLALRGLLGSRKDLMPDMP